MKRAERYGAKSLEKDFPTEAAALDFLFDAQHSRDCSCGGRYTKLSQRKQYQCSKCRFQIAPTSGTIFHKSDTPLLVWFKAILAFSNAKSSISAKQLERELEITYKTAWRMLMLIRQALQQSDRQLRGIVEIDSGFLGGVKELKKRMSNKTTVLAAVERGGEFRAHVIPSNSALVHKAFLDRYVERKSFLMSDQTNVLKHSSRGYDHHTVNHSKEYARGPVHVNNVENFFSHLKRSIRGVHKAISPEHAQAYLNGFVFHWNNRYSDRQRFAVLLGILLRPAK